MVSFRKAFWFVVFVLSTPYSVLCTPAHAHPVPRRIHDRLIAVRLAADAVTVAYHLELDELTAYDDLPSVIDPKDLPKVNKDNFYDTFTHLYAPILAGNLTAKLDGTPLEFTCVRRQARLVDSVWCDFVFRAPWQPARDRQHTFNFYEGNYEEEAGQVKLSLTDDRPALPVFYACTVGVLSPPDGQGPLLAASGLVPGRTEPSVTLLEKNEPDEALKNRPPIDLRPGDAPRLRKASATFTLPTTAAPAVTKVESPAEELATPAPAARTNNLVGLLLDTRQGMLLLLVLAACLGAAHALTPGHGKTMVAAYLVGERGTVWHALLLGVATTLTHTGVVLALAAVLRFFPRDALGPIQSVLGLVGGLAIAGVGFWLLLRRLSGRADHFHIGGHGHHHQDHDHGHGDHSHDEHGHVHALPAGGERAGWWSVTVLGITGGIVPCGDAIIMLVYAISAGLLWLALPLLLAFSAGLAAVLIAVGVLVVSAKHVTRGRLEGRGFRRLTGALPIASAVLVIGMGLWLCRESLSAPPPPATQFQSPP